MAAYRKAGLGVLALVGGATALGWALWTRGQTQPAPGMPAGLVSALPAEAATQPGAEAETPLRSDAPAARSVQIDVVRIEPGGSGLVAGQVFQPGAVVLRLEDTVLTRVAPDASGAFVGFVQVPPSDQPRRLFIAQDGSTAPEAWVMLAPLSGAHPRITSQPPVAVATDNGQPAGSEDQEPSIRGAALAMGEAGTGGDGAPVSDARSMATVAETGGGQPAAGSETAAEVASVQEPAAVNADPSASDASAAVPMAASQAGGVPQDLAVVIADPSASDASAAVPMAASQAGGVPQDLAGVIADPSASDASAAVPMAASQAGGVPQDLAVDATPAPAPESVLAQVATPSATDGSAVARPRTGAEPAGQGAAPAIGTSIALAQQAVSGFASDAPDMPRPVVEGPPSAPLVAPLLVSDADGVRALSTASVPPESVSLSVVSYAANGDVQLSGEAGSGVEALRLYVDNQPLRDAPTRPEGRWHVALPEVAPGTYTLRVDALDAAGAVVARVESPFRREPPETVAAALADAGPDARITEHTVQPGNTLWAIAERTYGDGVLYVQLFRANRDQIRNPDLIYPGQVFRLPELDPAPER